MPCDLSSGTNGSRMMSLDSTASILDHVSTQGRRFRNRRAAEAEPLGVGQPDVAAAGGAGVEDQLRPPGIGGAQRVPEQAELGQIGPRRVGLLAGEEGEPVALGPSL